MPPRLAHTKSRRGCRRCKARKVKCDELHPSCSACRRHGVPCEYAPSRGTSLGASDHNSLSETSHLFDREDTSSGPTEDVASSTEAIRVSGPASPYEADPIDIDPEDRRRLELQLLHHHMLAVSATFPAHVEPRMQNVWRTEALYFAFEHSFLLNAILALSALHAAVEGIADPRPISSRLPSNFDYARAHRIYLNRAVQEQRIALSALGPSNAAAVCLTSIALSIVALKLLPEYHTTTYTPPVQWLSMTNAIGTVIQASAPFVQNDPLIEGITQVKDPDFQDKAAIFDPAGLVPFQGILDFHAVSETESEETKMQYKTVLTYVGGVNRAVSNRDPPRQVCRRIMSFGPMNPRGYVTLLEERRPRALVILAHLMSMAKYVESYWWFRGAAEREVFGIQSILPQEWQWAMTWPIQTLHNLSEVKKEENGIES